ncbi:dethiobiotin synthase [Sphingobacterium lactis]|uniref:dethiobiotin synthase n=1 Tax=Sphingobacterium lactis TaxID=797291 RepID=UPI003EC7EFE0
MMNKRYFITGIGTEVGKTVVSAALVDYFGTTYWKPIQSGDLQASDSMRIRALCSSAPAIFPERYQLKHPASPHDASEREGIHISLTDFSLPNQTAALMVEGAGGLFVPINSEEFMIDLMDQLGLPAILVCRDYLGCINHTLLSIAALVHKGIQLAFVVFNGAFEPATQRVIESHLPVGTDAIYIPEIKEINKMNLSTAVGQIKIVEHTNGAFRK